MKKLILAASLLALTGAANASSLRLNNGAVLINKGTPANVLTQHAGYPSHRSVNVVCMKYRSRDVCQDWGRIESWFYTIDGINWEIKIHQGRVFDLEWSRF